MDVKLDLNLKILHRVIILSLMAGERILEVYASMDSGQQAKAAQKKDDDSPLTRADRLSHELITFELGKNFPEIPVLSEEGSQIDYDERKNWRQFWLVDPLDGTKEFIKKNGEFTVNIALIEDGTPVLGVVYAPALGQIYYGMREYGSFKSEISSDIWSSSFKDSDLSSAQGEEIIKFIQRSERKMPLSAESSEHSDIITLVVSRSHMNRDTENFLQETEKRFPGKKISTISIGSSLKLCLVAEGRANIYPRLGPTMEWDTAAAQAVVNFSGKKVLQYPGNSPLIYNKENLLNPWFVVQ